MFTLEHDGGATDFEVSFLTAQLYEAEFSSDMIADLYGKYDDGEGEFTFTTTVDENGKPVTTVTGIDYTKVPWCAVSKALWAAAKTANPLVGGYASWAESFRGVNLWDARDMLIKEVRSCFFRAAGAAEEDEEGQD